MIRPEAKAQMMRWREVLVGSAAVLLGLWWLAGPRGLLSLPAAVLILGGGALIWIGVQRARFRSAGAGPGAVQVDEGQITYFGPLTGGSVSLRELSAITLDPTLHPTHWRLEEPGQPPLLIPVNSEGADTLFDAFATLPEFRMTHALAIMKAPGVHPIVIWHRDLSISAQRTLH